MDVCKSKQNRIHKLGCPQHFLYSLLFYFSCLFHLSVPHDYSQGTLDKCEPEEAEEELRRIAEDNQIDTDNVNWTDMEGEDEPEQEPDKKDKETEEEKKDEESKKPGKKSSEETEK